MKLVIIGDFLFFYFCLLLSVLWLCTVCMEDCDSNLHCELETYLTVLLEHGLFIVFVVLVWSFLSAHFYVILCC